jgi:hypothetical protein
LLATSPRLKAVPEQQVLTVSNQVDSTQKGAGEFTNMVHFVNTLRIKYCEQQGTNGLRSLLSASSTPLHGHISKNTSFNAITIGGTLMRDWLGQAMAAPDSVIDKVTTGTMARAVEVSA